MNNIAVVYSKSHNTLCLLQEGEATPSDWFTTFIDIEGKIYLVDISDVVFVGWL